MMGSGGRAALWTSVGLLIWAQEVGAETSTTAQLKKMSLEELMSLEVTSVSKVPENLGGAAAAVVVLTGEELRRSGATTIPEALRSLPGIFVARRNANSWAVSSRGFSSVNSEKLLVLSDTRSIYTPLFSGVSWDVQDYVLDDVDRIEVIRGPGAALWGSNAVNGVINITTKGARDTLGAYFDGTVGTEEQAGAARWGGRMGEDISYRVFGRYFDRDTSANSTPITSDDWRMGHVGFRADWDRSERDALTLQGDLYDGRIAELAPAVTIIGRPGPQGDLEARVNGGNVLGRWRHTISADSDLQLRAYYDRTHRNDPSFVDDLDTFDLDVQHRFGWAHRHDVIWGLNYRLTLNRNEGKGVFAVDPPSSRDTLVSAFVQDQLTLFDALRVTLGTKLEHNEFSGFEVQPSVRVAWDLSSRQTFWGAVSRAVRVPTRLERDIAIDVSDPAGNPIVRLLGNHAFDSEKLTAYELGYRWQVSPALFIDTTVFENRYRGLASLEVGAPFLDPADGRTVVPIGNENLTDGHAEGLEILANLAPPGRWRVTGSYSYLRLRLDPHGMDINRGEFLEGTTPRHQFGLRSSLDLPRGFQVDAMFRRVGGVRSDPQIVTGEGISAYSELDLRVAWRGRKGWELSLVGQNLLHSRHAEFGAPESRGEMERGVYGRVVWRGKGGEGSARRDRRQIFGITSTFDEAYLEPAGPMVYTQSH